MAHLLLVTCLLTSLEWSTALLRSGGAKVHGQCPARAGAATTTATKLIVYNGRFGKPPHQNLGCSMPCEVRLAPKNMYEADAVVWNEAGMLLTSRMPGQKPAGQKWVYAFWFEPPNRNEEFELRKGRATSTLDSKHIVDWTMTYSPTSDFSWPMQKLVPLGSTSNHLRSCDAEEGADFERMPLLVESVNASAPRKLLLALISNCEGPRMEFLRRLKQSLPPGSVDIFGSCGSTSPCPGRHENDQCHRRLFSNYKFYAAFENRRFQGYISEKIFRAFQWGMVPIAAGGLGRKDYEALGIPKSAMVHIDDFSSVNELAKFMTSMDETTRSKYFAWRQHLRIASQLESRVDAFCDLCLELHKPPELQKASRVFGKNLTKW
eukprot:CAMPEP_0171096064 /NCGR_PEP_ID=MMETSP0766_2-20121228/43534_1 /TAXON_ID=439317 /ORGANISM="Gambierdiscus australes, Strain CAWD 149" /LENGTH=376 /DNA_ID=CAMNT_0011554961 /DNA_START=86 /DNA_END=1213 /DNA_ORIENTATION=-